MSLTVRYIPLAVSVLLAEGIGVLGSIATAQSVHTWYPELIKPAWNPPSWIFGPVWTTLFVLMGVAAYRIWNTRRIPGTARALTVYGVQLGLNLLWSLLFFGLRHPGYAAVEILILIGCIGYTTALFWKIDRWAGALLLPYLAWVSFASVLNGYIWLLNR